MLDSALSMSESGLTQWLETYPLQEQPELLHLLKGRSEQRRNQPQKNDPSSLAKSDYASDRSAKAAESINAKTAAAQEIGPLPDIVNPQRRERAALDNLLFAETYFAPTFYLPWASYQRAMMDRFQAVILDSGRECHAVRRGGLKSTCARVSAMWAAINGHRQFLVLVGASDDKANEHRANFFDMMQSSQLLLEDYPELLPLILKRRQPKRQFRLDGRLLEVHPKDDKGRIVFADIHDAASCQAHIAPYSINSTDVSGLSFVDRFGVTVRPDCLIFDDVQTPQSALSPSMTSQREDRITKTFCGLAGLGEELAAIMVGTVREHDDLTERFIDRKRHSDWFGRKYPSLLKMPQRMNLWDANAALLGKGASPADGKQMAVEHYVENRTEMDRGGRVAWEHDKLPDEPSALFSMMTIRALDPAFFRCEIQQDGEAPVNTSGLKLDASDLMNRLSHVERGVVPSQASYLTAFVDSSDEVLWFAVVAWTSQFGGWLVDYGTWPDQGRAVFYKSDLAHTISRQLPGESWESAFVHAHNQLDDYLLREWVTDDGSSMPVDILLKDWSDGQHKPRLTSQVMASRHRDRIRLSKGFAPKPGRKPVADYGDKQRDRNGPGWVERRTDEPKHVQFDANLLKSFLARRLLSVVGSETAVTLPGKDENANRLLCEHLTAEVPKTMVYDGATGSVWEQPPGRDNDWFDCVVGCGLGASMLGCMLPGEVSTRKELRTFSLPGGAKR